MDEILHWLMEGDPAVRWQTMRDLLDAPEREWRTEQQRTLTEGWAARYLALQDTDGRWGGGIYSPKWVSTTYTLLTLINLGIPPEYPPARQAAQLVLSDLLGETCDARFQKNLAALDRCIVGMVLQISVYFRIVDVSAAGGAVDLILDNLLIERMPDGAWNCRRMRHPRPHHSSFHTSLNVLEGVRTYFECRGGAGREDVLAAEQGALEWMLQHRLYQSDHTGEVIDPKFTLLSFPFYWRYDLLRGLGYFARAGAPRDSRLQDAVDLLNHRRRKDGRWPVQQRHPGRVFFHMEKTGEASRWNTLRALRVLRWWGEGG